MKAILLLMLSQLLVACLMTPNPGHPSRRFATPENDIENLEELLLNEQQPIYEARRQTSSTQSLRLGMPKNRVKRRLGLPTHVEVAGNPKYGNERWIYENAVPTLEGYYQEKHVIYFESGSVVGWESN